MAASTQSDNDWEGDDRMKRLRARKHKLEEKEFYNAPEIMRKKRRAVKEQAKVAPKASSTTSLDFDDAVNEADTPRDTTPAAAPKPKMTVQEARKARRAGAKQRREEGADTIKCEAGEQIKREAGEEIEVKPAQRPRRRKDYVREAQKAAAATAVHASPSSAAIKAS